MSTKYTVLIIGSGFTGTTVAIRLLQQAEEPLKIILVEKRREQKFGGLAYGAKHIEWEHVLNIQAGRISIYREHPDHFLDWINSQAADKSNWPSKLKTQIYGKSSSVSRKVYNQYLQYCFEEATENASPDVECIQQYLDVVDLEEYDGYVRVYFKNATSVDVNQVVIATGHQEFMLPACAAQIVNHPSFVRNPYSQKFQQVLQELDHAATVFVMGTGLSAFDVVVSLLNNNHQGRIILCSRHGYIHNTYPDDHTHDILRLRRPPFIDYEQPLTPQAIVHGFMEEFEAQKEELLNKGVPSSIIPERILKSWEPYVVEIIQRLEPIDVQQLLKAYKSKIITLRTSVVPELGNLIADSKNHHQLEIWAGEIQKIDSSFYNLGFTVSVACPQTGMEKSIKTHAIINATGIETDYTKIEDKFWRTLIDKRKYVVPHRKTKLGIEVGPYGEIIDDQGKLSKRIITVGPMRQGDELERRGRLGAFVFSIGTLRNQALFAALTIIKRSDWDTYMTMYPDLAKKDATQLTEKIYTYLSEMEISKLVESAKQRIIKPCTKMFLWLEIEELVNKVFERFPHTNVDRKLIGRIILNTVKLKAAEDLADISKPPEYYENQDFNASV